MQSANSTTPRKDTKEIENTVSGFKDIVIQREREKKKDTPDPLKLTIKSSPPPTANSTQTTLLPHVD